MIVHDQTVLLRVIAGEVSETQKHMFSDIQKVTHRNDSCSGDNRNGDFRETYPSKECLSQEVSQMLAKQHCK